MEEPTLLEVILNLSTSLRTQSASKICKINNRIFIALNNLINHMVAIKEETAEEDKWQA